MAAPSSQPLPSKENALFRQLVRFYETKQYKKAVKAADQVSVLRPPHSGAGRQGRGSRCMVHHRSSRSSRTMGRRWQ
jgi:hypothetical protein